MELADLEQLLGIIYTIKDHSTSITPDQTRLFKLIGSLIQASGTE